MVTVGANQPQLRKLIAEADPSGSAFLFAWEISVWMCKFVAADVALRLDYRRRSRPTIPNPRR